MNRRLLLAGLSLGAISLCIGVFALSMERETKFVEGSQILYSLTLDTDHRIVDNTIKTDLGNDIPVDLYGVTTDDPDYFFVAKNVSHQDYCHIRNRIPINGVTKIRYVLGSASEKIRIYYSHQYNQFDTKSYLLSSGKEGELDFNLEGGNPSYFSITPDDFGEKSMTAHIEQLVFYYTCQPAPDPVVPQSEWDRWTYENVSDQSIHKRLTGFSINQEDIPENKTLVVPNTIGGQEVDAINDEILANVDWVEHLVIPFVGGFRYLQSGGLGASFGRLFSTSAKPLNKYQAVTQYGETFYIPRSLKKITLNYGNVVEGETTVCLPNYSFYGMNQIEEFTLNARVKIIGLNVFSGCVGLEEIYLPNTVTSIGAGAFTGCSNLTIRTYGNINVSANANPDARPVTENYIESFSDSTFIYDIYDGGLDKYLNVMSLVNEANITELTIPSYVTYRGETYEVASIANRAFENIPSLKNVFININIQKVGKYAFNGSFKATVFLPGLRYDEIYLAGWDYSIAAYYENFVSGPVTKADHVNYYQLIDDKYVVESISDDSHDITFNPIESDYVLFFGAYCCEGNEDLEIIHIPHNIVSGGFASYAFYGCSNLISVYFDGTVDEWGDIVKNKMGPFVKITNQRF